MSHLARRLSDAGELRDDVTVKDAESVLWVLTSFESFDSLYTGRELPLDEVVESWSRLLNGRCAGQLLDEAVTAAHCASSFSLLMQPPRCGPAGHPAGPGSP